MVEFVRMSLPVLASYSALGLLFAAAFHWRGLHALDPGSHGTGIGFRLLIAPGIVALWPLLALRWWRARRGDSFLGEQDAPFSSRRLRATHALGWKALAMIVPLVVAAALWWRPKDAPRSMVPTSHHLQKPSHQTDRAPSAAGGAGKFKQGNALALGARRSGLP